MSRQFFRLLALQLGTALALTGCHPTQPFFFFDDGDLSHYLDVATEIDYPDVNEPSLEEVDGSDRPLTLENAEAQSYWELSLQDATRIMLENSQVMRRLGGQVAPSGPDTLSRLTLSQGFNTVYDPALLETGYGPATAPGLGGTGVEAALSEFDAQLNASMIWEKNDRAQNVVNIAAQNFQQDLGRFNAGITKTTATGGTFTFQNNTNYDQNNNPPTVRILPSDWTTNFETIFNQPLLQGAGVQYNRIAGPQSFNAFAAQQPNTIDGVIISRINTDRALADFEGGVRDLVKELEDAYWNLYFAYRNLHARKIGRDSAQETWKRVHALFVTGSRGGEADKVAQSKSQYYFFRSEVETALSELYRRENNLRYIMGLAVSDGRLIRPMDEPTTAKVNFDWNMIVHESLARRVELRKKRWDVKQRELQLIAARNHLLPRLDAVGRYRWNGLGDDLIDTNRSGLPPSSPGSNAFESLTSGQFQEWQLGLQLNVPIGFRLQMTEVRHHQLLLARERSVLKDLELEIQHQVGHAIRDLEENYSVAQSNFNRRAASQQEVQAVEEAYKASQVTLDLLLNAQQRLADSESAYYQSLVAYNQSISQVHVRKGSLLDYNGVYLAEGPWPGKAYFDAMRLARKRDASMYLDYGFTRPNVISRGAYQQRDEVPSEATSSLPIEFTPSDPVVEEVLPLETLPPGLEVPGESAPPSDPDIEDFPLEPELEAPDQTDANERTARLPREPKPLLLSPSPAATSPSRGDTSQPRKQSEKRSVIKRRTIQQPSGLGRAADSTSQAPGKQSSSNWSKRRRTSVRPTVAYSSSTAPEPSRLRQPKPEESKTASGSASTIGKSSGWRKR